MEDTLLSWLNMQKVIVFSFCFYKQRAACLSRIHKHWRRFIQSSKNVCNNGEIPLIGSLILLTKGCWIHYMTITCVTSVWKLLDICIWCMNRFLEKSIFVHDCGRCKEEHQLSVAMMMSTTFNHNRQCNTWRAAVQKWQFLTSVCLRWVTLYWCSPSGEKPWVLLMLQFKAEQVGPSLWFNVESSSVSCPDRILHSNMWKRDPLLLRKDWYTLTW